MEKKKTVVVSGREGPGFELVTPDGDMVRLNDRFGRGRQTILIFLRYLG